MAYLELFCGGTYKNLELQTRKPWNAVSRGSVVCVCSGGSVDWNAGKMQAVKTVLMRFWRGIKSVGSRSEAIHIFLWHRI